MSVGVRYQVLERDTLTNKTHAYCYSISGKTQHSNAEGHFYFNFDSDPVEADEYQVLIQTPGHPLFCWIAHPFPEPGEQVLFALPEATAPFIIEVVDEHTGEAIAGASVVLSPIFVRASREIIIDEQLLPVETSAFSMKTDASGEVIVHLPRNDKTYELKVTAVAEGHVKRMVDVQLAAQLMPKRIKIALSPTGVGVHRPCHNLNEGACPTPNEGDCDRLFLYCHGYYNHSN
jgi:hypothetical protein